MTVKSSKNGTLKIGASDLAEVRNWRFEKNSNNRTYASSSTAGHQKTVDGQKSGTVSFDVVYDPDDPIEDRVKVGDQVTLEAYYDATRKYSIPLRMERMSDEVQIEQGEPPTVACEAQTHGAWTYPDGTLST